MWDALNLHLHVRYMQQAPAVFVVTDSDWLTNPQVAKQARLCVEHLRGHDIQAIHVAPPTTLEKDGVGDLLGRGGRLEELEVIPNVPEAAPVEERVRALGKRRDAERNILGVAGALLVLGTASFQTNHARRVLKNAGVKKASLALDKMVERAFEGLAEAGVIVRTKEWKNRPGADGWHRKPAVWGWSRELAPVEAIDLEWGKE